MSNPYELTQVKDQILVKGEGLFTLVLETDLLVVSGFVVSPFAVSHSVPHNYYKLHRWLHHFLPHAWIGTSMERELNIWIGDVTNALFSSALGV